jgi:hypothetical protein
LTTNEKLVVIVHYPGGNFENLPTANAFAFDKNGNLLWTIQEYAPYDNLAKDHYIRFELDEETGRIIVGTFIGHRAELNLDTGKIILLDVGGRPW